MSNCDYCENSYECLNCSDSYYLYELGCLNDTSCPTGYYPNKAADIGEIRKCECIFLFPFFKAINLY